MYGFVPQRCSAHLLDEKYTVYKGKCTLIHVLGSLNLLHRGYTEEEHCIIVLQHMDKDLEDVAKLFRFFTSLIILLELYNIFHFQYSNYWNGTIPFGNGPTWNRLIWGRTMSSILKRTWSEEKPISPLDPSDWQSRVTEDFASSICL